MDLYEAMRCAPDEPALQPTSRSRARCCVRALEAARFAPSGGNRQGWRVVVVADPERSAALRDLYLPPWRDYMEQTGAAQMLGQTRATSTPARLRMVAPRRRVRREPRPGARCISCWVCAWTTWP